MRTSDRSSDVGSNASGPSRPPARPPSNAGSSASSSASLHKASRDSEARRGDRSSGNNNNSSSSSGGGGNRRSGSISGRSDSSAEERQSLLSNSETSNSKEQERRDACVADALDGLNYIVYTVAWTIIFVLILCFVNEFTDDSIPIWGIFLVLWVGHFVFFYLIMRTIRLVLRSLIAKNEQERFTQRWHQANERRIPLIQFIMYNIAWTFGVSVLLVVMEIQLYLYSLSMVPFWSAFVPVFIFTSVAIANSLICKSTSVSGIVTWVLVLAFTVLLNIQSLQTTSSNTTNLTYTLVFIPVFLLFGYWFLQFIILWINYLFSVYKLKQHQIEALAFYLLAFVTLFLSSFSFASYMDGEDFYGYSYLKISAALAIIGSCSFFLALAKVVAFSIDTIQKRMGADRPKNLVRLEGGGWDLDTENSYEVYVILGEIDFKGSLWKSMCTTEKSPFHRFICGCCGVEMISQGQGNNDNRTSFSNGGDGGSHSYGNAVFNPLPTPIAGPPRGGSYVPQAQANIV